MAKEKVLKLSGNRELGAVTKKLSSGMFETSKGEKVPPLPGITIGTKVRLVKSRFEIVDGEKKTVGSTEDADKGEMAALKKQVAAQNKKIAALEKSQGEKGSAVKGTGDEETGDGVDTKTTPPKVGA